MTRNFSGAVTYSQGRQRRPKKVTVDQKLRLARPGGRPRPGWPGSPKLPHPCLTPASLTIATPAPVTHVIPAPVTLVTPALPLHQ